MADLADAEESILNWTIALQRAERIERADPDDDDGSLFSVERPPAPT